MRTLWSLVDNDRILYIKSTVALIAAAALLLPLHPATRRLTRLRDVTLGVCGALSLLCWFNLGHFHFDGYVHYYDQYHYYIGAKYFRELGYTRLYPCTALAMARYQPARASAVARLKIRNLVDNRLEGAEVALAHPDECLQQFSPERWRDFQRDVDFFRSNLSWNTFNEALRDHGYNATPVWGMVGGALANLGPASRDRVLWIGLLDPLLLLAMWGFVLWAFGWRTACVALVFWGCNYPARYWWNGGALLRMDWLFAAVAGVCLVKKERPLTGGFLLGWATLLRIFPGFLVAALLLKIVFACARARTLVVTPAQRRFVLGGALAVALLVPLSAAASGGFSAWRGFVDNSRKHLSTPLTNQMGWKTIVAFDPATSAVVTKDPRLEDPFERWKDARRRTFAARRVVFFIGLVAFLALLGAAAARHDDWMALALGAGLIVVAGDLTCYYYSVLLLFGLLWPRLRLIGAGSAMLAALSCFVPYWLWWDDARFTLISLFCLAFSVAAAVTLLRTPPSAAAPPG